MVVHGRVLLGREDERNWRENKAQLPDPFQRKRTLRPSGGGGVGLIGRSPDEQVPSLSSSEDAWIPLGTLS